ncbi:MAG: hypothetical protein LBJ18_02355 [Rickettsiales bacterium]|jgi:hypothetical protein|nr:hypothetical protein [Rickettsiales bacterium]
MKNKMKILVLSALLLAASAQAQDSQTARANSDSAKLDTIGAPAKVALMRQMVAAKISELLEKRAQVQKTNIDVVFQDQIQAAVKKHYERYGLVKYDAVVNNKENLAAIRVEQLDMIDGPYISWLADHGAAAAKPVIKAAEARAIIESAIYSLENGQKIVFPYNQSKQNEEEIFAFQAFGQQVNILELAGKKSKKDLMKLTAKWAENGK